MGRIDSLQDDPHFAVKDEAGKLLETHVWGAGNSIDHGAALRYLTRWLQAKLSDARIYISRQLPKFAPDARRVIVAHLGGGASMCAMQDGRSVETTMGFGTLSGLPMATRAGEVPAAALLYLLRSKRFDAATLEKMLYERSGLLGLLGLCGISGDMRELQDSADPQVISAVAHFVYAMTKYVGAYTAVLGGLDALVFTAGIGENSAPLRAALCGKLASFGVKLDESSNTAGRPCISSVDSEVSVWVIPTDEEWMIAQHTLAVIDC